MTDPLLGLDAVPWATLHHAYGPANDTPGLLRRLERGDIDETLWEELFSSLAHQGTVYEASAAAAPFLIALTSSLHGEDLVSVLQMLDDIANGGADEPQTSQR